MKLKLLLLSCIFLCFSCNKDFKSEKETPIGVFNAMWKFVDENYVFIDLKNLDMEALKTFYSNQISDETTDSELFEICSNFLFELKDGHCFLDNGTTNSRYDTSEGISSPFSLELVKQNYIQENLQEYEYHITGFINDSIGYIHLKEFERIEEIREAIRDMNQLLQNGDKIIFDVRDNSGGDPQVALTTASSFMEKDILLGQVIHKNGKSHNDFTDPVEIFSEDLPFRFENKVRLLTNKNSYSASSYLAGMWQHSDNVTIIGQTTGGGGGDVTSLELPNGWVVAVTVNFFLDAMGNHIENGVLADIEIENTIDQIDAGIDSILEEAINR